MRASTTFVAVKSLLLFVFLLLPVLVLAQTPPGFPDLPPEAPIDGGLGLLVLGGGAYALKKLRDRSRME